ncbi:hypothetical protein TNCV_2207761 [Trichonephila clavipes]|uniref:Uncharacterized protein n=1 Tax=Trichonephila clavipes TaxID=2585209 RepID=A0A8X6VGM6_TRICX|nr:hypothetical protein TNCV_2207761 [Trichonephila clavipes]
MKNNPKSTQNFLQIHNRFIYHPQIEATLFAEFFASNNSNHDPLPLEFFAQDNSLINKHFHLSELNRTIRTARNTIPSADQIPATFLKLLKESDCRAILNLFQQLFDNLTVPKSSKHDIILPIPKHAKTRPKISPYRPTFLTSVSL